MDTQALDGERALALYRTMARIRAFEDAAEEASIGGVAAFGATLSRANVRGPLHLSTGQEAVAAGVCAHLRKTDLLTSTHRGHGHTIAKGAALDRMMAELFGRATGYNRGKGGSMHIADFSVGMLGANGVVADGIPIAVGAAHALRARGGDGVVACFFGDGAINRGPFLEGLNWAAARSLPILFVCEDNLWAATTETGSTTAGPGALARAEAIGVPGRKVDGNDVIEVWRATGALLAEVRQGVPRMLHAVTYRVKGHVSVDAAGYRDAVKHDRELERDPMVIAAARLGAMGIPRAKLEAIGSEAKAEVAAALAAAHAAPLPDPKAAYEEVQDTGAGRWRE
jgi:TPP-dependent pyruvate/acetoin dehydrogenase alpha subunit